jgi:hypothetical protein
MIPITLNKILPPSLIDISPQHGGGSIYWDKDNFLIFLNFPNPSKGEIEGIQKGLISFSYMDFPNVGFLNLESRSRPKGYGDRIKSKLLIPPQELPLSIGFLKGSPEYPPMDYQSELRLSPAIVLVDQGMVVRALRFLTIPTELTRIIINHQSSIPSISRSSYLGMVDQIFADHPVGAIASMGIKRYGVFFGGS